MNRASLIRRHLGVDSGGGISNPPAIGAPTKDHMGSITDAIGASSRLASRWSRPV